MGMKREEDPQLWDLLGRSKSAVPSPFFARNVVRAARTEIPERDGLSGWFNLRRLVPALSAAAAVAIVASTFQVLHHRGSPHRDLTTAELQDSNVAADLDLLASNDDDDDPSLL
jgi:anti-sigma-K factor RskA